MITHIDDAMRGVVEALKRKGFYDNSLVIGQRALPPLPLSPAVSSTPPRACMRVASLRPFRLTPCCVVRRLW